MIRLSSSRMHVAILLDRLHAADHHQTLGHWPILLIITENARLQLDPASGHIRWPASQARFSQPPARNRWLPR